MGWVFRNDGVDLQWSKEEGSWNAGWIEPGEWIGYTVEVDSTADHVLVARVAGPGGRMDILVDGVVAARAPSTPTAGWTTWTDARTGPFRLEAGRHVLRLSMLEAGFNLAGIRVLRATQGCIDEGSCPTSASRAHAAGGLALRGGLLVWEGAERTSIDLLGIDGKARISGSFAPGSVVSGRMGTGIAFARIDGRVARIVLP